MTMPYDKRRANGQWMSRFLDVVGDGTGSTEANVDGSITPVDFHYFVPDGHTLLIYRLIVWIKDTGSLDADNYGNGLQLTNGILGGKTDALGNFLVRPSTLQTPVKTNGDWAAFSFNINYLDAGNTDNVMVARYTYTEDGAPLMFEENTAYTIRIGDDLTPLTGHRFRIGCVLCKNP
jgi:hypothetical protein